MGWDGWDMPVIIAGAVTGAVMLRMVHTMPVGDGYRYDT